MDDIQLWYTWFNRYSTLTEKLFRYDRIILDTYGATAKTIEIHDVLREAFKDITELWITGLEVLKC